MNKRKKEQKKKSREKAAHAKVVARREELRLERKEEARRLFLERSLEPKLKPIVSDPEVLSKRESKRKLDIQEQIENNYKILEALEQEYDKEQEDRKSINASLEAEGYKNIKDKMDALHQKALSQGYKEKEDNLVVNQ